MVRFFGKRMGLSFTLEASEYLHERYGGHPLLTRMACSEIHQTVERQKRVRGFPGRDYSPPPDTQCCLLVMGVGSGECFDSDFHLTGESWRKRSAL